MTPPRSVAKLARLALALGLTAVVARPVPAQQPPAATPASPAVTVTTVISATSFDSTLMRLEHAATANGLTISARIDHSAAARRAGLTLRPTTLVIAGNPAAGTPLMLADQTIGVELPLRFLVWEGEDGRVRVSYDPIEAVAARHAVRGQDVVLGKIAAATEAIVHAATAR